MESCQRQKYLINIWLLLFSWEPYGGLNWPRILWTVFFEHADTPGRRSQEPPITKQPGAPLFGCEITSLCGEIYFQRGTKNAHIALMMSPVCQIPCMRLTRHWLSMKRFHSGSAVIGEWANVVTPELGTKSSFAAWRLFDIVTRLLLCFQAQPQVLRWTLSDHTEKSNYKTYG